MLDTVPRCYLIVGVWLQLSGLQIVLNTEQYSEFLVQYAETAAAHKAEQEARAVHGVASSPVSFHIRLAS